MLRLVCRPPGREHSQTRQGSRSCATAARRRHYRLRAGKRHSFTCLIAENDEGLHKYNELREADLSHPVEKIGKDLRAMMPWLESTT